MNLLHSFASERPAAQHCAELLRTAPSPETLLPGLARVGERLARALSPMLATLTGADAPEIVAGPPELLDDGQLEAELGQLTASSLLASPAGGTSLLASIGGRAVLQLVDRMFGGRGTVADSLPDRFALSAEMMVGKLEEIVTRCLAEVLDLPDLACQRRGSRLSDLAPFAPGTQLAVLRLTVADERAPWDILVALPLAHLPALPCCTVRERAAASRPGADRHAAEPFAGIALPLTATLVDMRVPLSAIAALEPGTVLPVAVARAVPVSVGGTVVARGTIGSEDDRLAVRITQIF